MALALGTTRAADRPPCSAWTSVRGLTKVPRITIFFWIIKVCCTTVGETLSDLVSETAGLGLGIAAAIFFPILLAATCTQLWVRRYVCPLYWLVVILMSICGTIATDGLHDDAGLQLWIEIIVFGALMCATFWAWARYEGTLAIHSIYTLRRETFYWFTIIWTFSLGTAVGDGISEAWGISFGAIFGFFAGIMAAIFVIWLALRVAGRCPRGSWQEILLFWVAYVMTRPLGASLGDLLSTDKAEGGAGLGTRDTSLILLGVILLCIIICVVSGYDVIPPEDDLALAASSALVHPIGSSAHEGVAADSLPPPKTHAIEDGAAEGSAGANGQATGSRPASALGAAAVADAV